MTMSDIFFWGSDAFIGVILILFVLNFIDGGSATHLGLAFLLYKAVAAVISIPVGRFFDKHPGYLDELWGLAMASFLAGMVYISLSFASELWQLYSAMFLLGITSVIQVLSWRTLFYNNIEHAEYSQTIGIYQAIFSFFQGVAIALGGFVGDTFGFSTAVFAGGVVIALGGLFPLSIRYLFAKR